VLIEELEEECGIQPSEILSASETPVHEYFMVVGSSPASIQLYEIRVKAQSDKQVDDADVDEVRWVTHKEMEQIIQEGLICDGKTIIAYYFLKSKIQA
jgi:ADP-ribose pyrophosphatase